MMDAFEEALSYLGLAGSSQGGTDQGSAKAGGSYTNLDVSDVQAVLQGADAVLCGQGSASGEDRAGKAAQSAVTLAGLAKGVHGVHGVLISISGSNDVELDEAKAAVEMVQTVLQPEARVIWGLTLDDACGDLLRVAVVAAVFKNE